MAPGTAPAVGAAYADFEGSGPGAVMRAGLADVTLRGEPMGQPGGNAAGGGSPSLAFAPPLPSYAGHDAVAVPEPHGLAVLALAMAAVGLMRRRV